MDRGLLLLFSKSVCTRFFDSYTTLSLYLSIQASNKPPLKPSLGTSHPSENPHLTHTSFPFSFTRLVYIRNITSGSNSRSFFWHFRIVEGLPKPLQLQLKILKAAGEAVWGQLPFAYLDMQGIYHHSTVQNEARHYQSNLQGY